MICMSTLELQCSCECKHFIICVVYQYSTNFNMFFLTESSRP